jgi:serine/threonine protein kinase/tetratricopeptide (TPR) repeat protein
MSNPSHDSNNKTTAAQTVSQAPDASAADALPPDGLSEKATAGGGGSVGGAASSVRVPGYRITDILGRGGMGVVYKAIQEKANRPVALKMILAGAHAAPGDRVRFRAEAEAAARLSHPHIVQLYDVGETLEGFPYFSLEFVAGGTLGERLKQGPLPAAEAAALIEALAGAMHYAHERGIVHRDLKPANILLAGQRNQESGVRSQTRKDEGGRMKDDTTRRLSDSSFILPPSSFTPLPSSLLPKISDFGLAKQLDTEDGMTRTGAIIGTPAYMAPEQAFGQSKNVGPSADIYALGAILYECLTGRPPFRGATVADILEQVRTTEPIAVRMLVKEIPADLETICLHCLHKEPARRYPTADALAEDLRRYRDGQPIRVRPVGRLERTWRWCRRNPWLASTMALAALLLIAVAGVSTYAYFDAEARNVEIEKKRQEAEAAQKVAKARLDQSLQALGLFATDFRSFCEDALVPGENKTKLYEALINQLERQTVEDVGEASEDALRNKAWMYQTIAIVYLDTQKYEKARPTVEKGLQVCKTWLDLKPGDAYAMSFYAAFLSLKGDASSTEKERLHYYHETQKLRRQLVGNEAVDQFTPGRALMQLADTLDKLHEYDESLVLRERICNLQIAKGVDNDKLYESLDFWSWTCWKAYLEIRDETRKQALLEKAVEVGERALKVRPRARRTLERLSGVLRELGDRAYNRAKEAESRMDRAATQKHADAAQVYFEKLADVARQLAVAPDFMYSLSNYARSFYALGLMQKNLGKHQEARVSFQNSRHIREGLLRDFAKTPYIVMLRIDLLFSKVALGEHADAVREADAIREASRSDPASQAGTLYRLACIYSLSAAAVEESRAPSPLTPADKALQSEYRDKALTALEQSYKSGNRDFAYARVDADFIPIRDDPRFERILALEKKGK